jgi:shikimate dehydrogenase
MTDTTKKFAVVGHPIAHSLSPEIHQLFSEQFGIQMTYEKIDIDPKNFFVSLQKLSEAGYQGFNVTLPFKYNAFELCDVLSDRAKYTKSVNTLTVNNGQFLGETTDGLGLIQDLKNKQFDIKNSIILLVGAGGASNAVLYDLILNQPNTIFLTNRTIDKSQKMKSDWNSFADLNDVKLMVTPLQDLFKVNFNLIINATSAGLNDNKSPISSLILNKFHVCYDMTYGQKTPFMQEALQKNAVVYDGSGMLIEQAAASFSIWHGHSPDVALIYKTLFK